MSGIVEAIRVNDGPIIEPATHGSIGDNINGPSLIEVPSWVRDPLGRFYLYFAHHRGDHIRLAFADDLRGPWTVLPGGVLSLPDSRFLTEEPAATEDEISFFADAYAETFGDHMPETGVRDDVVTPHIASPDVRVNDSYRMITMYFHGLESLGVQATRHATSVDGLRFDVDPQVIDGTHLRAFRHHETEYVLAMPGRIMRRNGRPTEFEVGPDVLPRSARHSAVQVVGDEIRIFWTRVGDAPERILLSRIDGRAHWLEWTASAPVEIMRPERVWEGADEPIRASTRGAANGRVNQLRDPAILDVGDRSFLVCAVAGESGLALNELHERRPTTFSR